MYLDKPQTFNQPISHKTRTKLVELFCFYEDYKKKNALPNKSDLQKIKRVCILYLEMCFNL